MYKRSQFSTSWSQKSIPCDMLYIVMGQKCLFKKKGEIVRVNCEGFRLDVQPHISDELVLARQQARRASPPCSSLTMRLSLSLSLFRTPQLAGQRELTQWLGCATSFHPRSRLVRCWTTRSTPPSTSSSCWVPVPFSPRPGLRSRGPLPKM